MKNYKDIESKSLTEKINKKKSTQRHMIIILQKTKYTITNS